MCVGVCLVCTDLVLQAAVFTLCVLPDDKDVNALVSGLDTWEGLAVHHIGIQIQTGAVDVHEKRQIQRKKGKPALNNNRLDKKGFCPKYRPFNQITHRSRLFLDLTEGGMVWFVSMLPDRIGQYK